MQGRCAGWEVKKGRRVLICYSLSLQLFKLVYVRLEKNNTTSLVQSCSKDVLCVASSPSLCWKRGVA